MNENTTSMQEPSCNVDNIWLNTRSPGVPLPARGARPVGRGGGGATGTRQACGAQLARSVRLVPTRLTARAEASWALLLNGCGASLNILAGVLEQALFDTLSRVLKATARTNEVVVQAPVAPPTHAPPTLFLFLHCGPNSIGLMKIESFILLVGTFLHFIHKGSLKSFWVTKSPCKGRSPFRNGLTC